MALQRMMEKKMEANNFKGCIYIYMYIYCWWELGSRALGGWISDPIRDPNMRWELGL